MNFAEKQSSLIQSHEFSSLKRKTAFESEKTDNDWPKTHKFRFHSSISWLGSSVGNRMSITKFD